MPELEGIAPIVPVSDVSATLAFYRDLLGFEVKVESPDGQYGLVSREGAGVTLVGAADEDALKATRTNISAYIWVKDLPGLWDEMRAGLEALPEGHVRAPFVQDYGMREFHVKDPDGFLIFFGEDAGNTGDA